MYGISQIQRHIDLFHDMFGAAGGSHGTFGDAVWSAAHTRIDHHTQQVIAHLFSFNRAPSSSGPSEKLSMGDFRAWYCQLPLAFFLAFSLSFSLARSGGSICACVLLPPRQPAQMRTREKGSAGIDLHFLPRARVHAYA
eukprot:COSAG05_NODE_3155_length_2280_cov_2.809262_1_plen_139_part_00